MALRTILANVMSVVMTVIGIQWQESYALVCMFQGLINFHCDNPPARSNMC